MLANNDQNRNSDKSFNGNTIVRGLLDHSIQLSNLIGGVSK